MQTTTMLDKDGNRFCCWLNGYGLLQDPKYFAAEDQWAYLPEVPGWIQRQGVFEVTGNQWKLDVGISHHDEEWRMTDDITDFLLENHTFVHKLSHGFQSHLHIGLHDSAVQGGRELKAETLALLSSLRINFSILWGYPPKNAESTVDPSPEKAD